MDFLCFYEDKVYLFHNIVFLTGQVMASSYHFRNLSVADGLPDLVVNALYKDSSGYVWFGTNTSLERFDGVYLKHYMIKGSTENLKRVYAIAEMPEKEIWVGTGNGLWRVNNRIHDIEHVASDIIETPVKVLLSDGKGILYIGTDKGLYVYKMVISNYYYSIKMSFL